MYIFTMYTCTHICMHACVYMYVCTYDVPFNAFMVSRGFTGLPVEWLDTVIEKTR